MNSDNLIIIAIVVLAVTLIGLILFVWLRPTPAPVTAPRRFVTDPALPAIQDAAIARLLQLPQFRRVLDGGLFDYYRGACLESCDCTRLPYPHLLLSYGGGQGVLFETAGSLEHYVSVQERVAATLMAGTVPSASPTTEVC